MVFQEIARTYSFLQQMQPRNSYIHFPPILPRCGQDFQNRELGVLQHPSQNIVSRFYWAVSEPDKIIPTRAYASVLGLMEPMSCFPSSTNLWKRVFQSNPASGKPAYMTLSDSAGHRFLRSMFVVSRITRIKWPHISRVISFFSHRTRLPNLRLFLVSILIDWYDPNGLT